LPLTDDVLGRLGAAIAKAERTQTVNVNYPEEVPVHATFVVNGKPLFDMISKGIRDKKITVDSGAVV
jgi:hypothetical protein